MLPASVGRERSQPGHGRAASQRAGAMANSENAVPAKTPFSRLWHFYSSLTFHCAMAVLLLCMVQQATPIRTIIEPQRARTFCANPPGQPYCEAL